jgi:hypothetical protein
LSFALSRRRHWVRVGRRVANILADFANIV